MINFDNLSLDDLAKQVRDLSARIEKVLDLKVEDAVTRIFDSPGPLPSLQVLEDLNKVMLCVIKKGYHQNLERELQIISALNQKIIAAHPIESHMVNDLSMEVLFKVLFPLSPKQLGSISTVSRSWAGAASCLQINTINEKRLNLKEHFPGFSAHKMVEWLIKNPNHEYLEYADFTGFEDFDNNCLEQITLKCPNLKHLFIENAKIKGDALKHLSPLTSLQSLDISECWQLESDALKHLSPLTSLQSLNIFYCDQLEPDALKHLSPLTSLQSLDISCCRQLERDALKHLSPLTELLSLNINWCDQLDRDFIPKNVKVFS